jgi:Na+-transporting NADH:ubiquinone oxidoreductase subunit NqrC
MNQPINPDRTIIVTRRIITVFLVLLLLAIVVIASYIYITRHTTSTATLDSEQSTLSTSTDESTVSTEQELVREEKQRIMLMPQPEIVEEGADGINVRRSETALTPEDKIKISNIAPQDPTDPTSATEAERRVILERLITQPAIIEE